MMMELASHSHLPLHAPMSPALDLMSDSSDFSTDFSPCNTLSPGNCSSGTDDNNSQQGGYHFENDNDTIINGFLPITNPVMPLSTSGFQFMGDASEVVDASVAPDATFQQLFPQSLFTAATSSHQEDGQSITFSTGNVPQSLNWSEDILQSSTSQTSTNSMNPFSLTMSTSTWHSETNFPHENVNDPDSEGTQNQEEVKEEDCGGDSSSMNLCSSSSSVASSPSMFSGKQGRKRKREGIYLNGEEVRTISSEDYCNIVDNYKASHILTAEEKKEVQRLKRLIRNREYAQRKRKSNKEKIKRVHETVQDQEQKIETLSSENSRLRLEVFRLQSILDCVLPLCQGTAAGAMVKNYRSQSVPPSIPGGLPVYHKQKRRKKDGDGQESGGEAGWIAAPSRKSVLVVLFSFGLLINTLSGGLLGGLGSASSGSEEKRSSRILLTNGDGVAYSLLKYVSDFYEYSIPSLHWKERSDVGTKGEFVTSLRDAAAAGSVTADILEDTTSVESQSAIIDREGRADAKRAGVMHVFDTANHGATQLDNEMGLSEDCDFHAQVNATAIHVNAVA